MKSILTAVFLIITAFCLKAQKTDCKDIMDKDGVAYLKGSEKPFTGKCTSWTDATHKAFESTYKGGKLNGKEITWNRKGIKISESTYKDGKYEGLVLHFYEDGKIKSRELYNPKRKTQCHSRNYTYISGENFRKCDARTLQFYRCLYYYHTLLLTFPKYFAAICLLNKYIYIMFTKS